MGGKGSRAITTPLPGDESAADAVPVRSAPGGEQRLVTGLLEAASGAPPLTRVLPEVATTLAQAIGMARATVLLHDRFGALVAGTSRTVDGTLDARMWAVFRLFHSAMPALAAARRGEGATVFLQPASATALGPGDWVVRFGARTVVVSPIRSPRRVLGVVVLDDPRQGAVDERRLAALDVATGGAGAVLELLEAVESERKARTRTEQVIETAAAAARSMSVSAALAAVTHGLQRLTGDELVIAAASSSDEIRAEWTGDAADARRAIAAFRNAGGTDGLAGAVTLEGTEARWAPLMGQGHTRALAVPLRHRSRDLGWVMSLGTAVEPHSADELQAAAVVGEQASLALHTTSLLEAERAAVDRLTELDVLKNSFLATVSHELRTPLTAILGFSELLAEEIHDSELAPHIDDLRREAAVLEALIGNLLNTSRLEAGLLQLNVHPVDLGASIAQAVEVVGHGHPGREIIFNAPDELRPIIADGSRLRQVFINLIENACKYSPHDRPVEVTIWPLRDDGDRVWIDVTTDDEGPGIPASERTRVFERFRRLDTHERTPGTGIGLYIVKALVEAHGGFITVEDRLAVPGSRFRVTLPIAADVA